MESQIRGGNLMEYMRITNENIDKEHICCAMSGKQSIKKKEWLKERFDEGLVFYRSVERGKCFIEYIPAENAWIPIEADGYIYINCLWIAGAMKGHGYSMICCRSVFVTQKHKGKRVFAYFLRIKEKKSFCQILNIWHTRDLLLPIQRIQELT